VRTSDFDAFLDQLLGVAEGQDRTPGEVARVKARLAILMDEAGENAAPASDGMAAGIVAFAGGALDEIEREHFEAEAAWPTSMSEVSDALEFLDDIGANLVSAPDDRVVEIHALFREGKPLSAQTQQAVLSDPGLRAEWTRIKQLYALRRPEMGTDDVMSRGVLEIPAVAAAASDRALEERTFPGGRVRIVKSSRGHDMLILLRIERRGSYPSALLLEGDRGEHARTALPAPDSDGRILLIKDMAKAEHAHFVRLLQDPRSRGTFLE
jgi:hypothetical protein